MSIHWEIKIHAQTMHPKMSKVVRMNFVCIISGCPKGARKWHIHVFCYVLHSKKTAPFFNDAV